MLKLRVETASQWGLAEQQGAQAGFVHAPGTAPPTVHAVAYANHGRWLADCPFNCGGARMVQPGIDFWCPFCGNVDVKGMGVVVLWPTDTADIDTMLRFRSLERNRNWIPGETLANLRKENSDNGQRTA